MIWIAALHCDGILVTASLVIKARCGRCRSPRGSPNTSSLSQSTRDPTLNFCIVHHVATCSISRYVCCFFILLTWRPLLYNDLIATEPLRVSFLLSPFVQRGTEIPALEIWLYFCLLCLHLVDDKLHIHRMLNFNYGGNDALGHRMTLPRHRNLPKSGPSFDTCQSRTIIAT